MKQTLHFNTTVQQGLCFELDIFYVTRLFFLN